MFCFASTPSRSRCRRCVSAAKTSCRWRTVFSASTRARYRKELTGFEEKARDQLMQHHWPGNVRELDHVIERAVLMTQGPLVKSNDLGLTSGHEDATRLEDMSLEEVEAFLIRKALSRFDGNARKAAEALGLSRSAFYRRLQHHGL